MNILAVLTGAVLAATAPLLVSTEELGKLSDACIVDARSEEDFVAGHIAGAVNLNTDTLSEKRGEVEGLLKPLDQLCRVVGEAGIDPKKHVVVYSDMASPEKRTDATRLFWALQYVGFSRVSVLDGGIGKWRTEGRAVATDKVKADAVTLRKDSVMEGYGCAEAACRGQKD
jgi:3-mercaptopyruvate sulfurtransferase SseA